MNGPQPNIPREKIPWFPAIRTDLCNGCRACLDFCPHQVYIWNEAGKRVKVDRPYECVVGCSNCLGLCPTGAISFPDLEEITAVIRRLRDEAAGSIPRSGT